MACIVKFILVKPNYFGVGDGGKIESGYYSKFVGIVFLCYVFCFVLLNFIQL